MTSNKLSSFDLYVIRAILANNEFNIKEVNDLQSIKSMGLDRNQYPEIVNMIKKGQLEVIEKLPFGTNDFEYLEIMKFFDQEGKEYILTIYDSSALEQDPQVIDIFAN